ncbi:MAG: right-handed parallel beta-helix repeat-containing protein [Lachnospiraceae bacterium]|nr:right-handed parallel beta-helix repeat-containing protein [Lachnospiraceae bacterium]
MKKKLIILMLLMICAMTACSKDSKDTAESTKKETEKTEDQDKEEESDKSQKKDKKKNKDSEQIKELEGIWNYVSEYYYYGDADDDLEDMESSYNSVVEGGLGGTAEFYEDEGEWYVDLALGEYESYYEKIHFPVEIVKGALYEECENQEWYVEAKNPRTEEVAFRATLIEDNVLKSFDEYVYDDEDSWKNINIRSFFREGSDKMDHVDDLSYTETVTVSNAEELLNEIGNNKKIILKPGNYDLSESKFKFNNEYVEAVTDNTMESDGYSGIIINNVSYLKLEAEGGEVEISIDSPYNSVLQFNNCYNIILEGLTCGHHVEPGTCGAPVIGTNSTYTMQVIDCHLYGSGSYGLEAYDSSSIEFKNTEIYECTYGIISGFNMNYSTFTGCNMHDNSQYVPIDLYDCTGITFEDCDFENNMIDKTNGYKTTFVYGDDDSESISFTNCRFKGNQYSEFSEGDVTIDDCTFDDETFKDLYNDED